jgi:carboxyl-terminal processing protease
LQDRGRAVLVGSRTFGKGTVQEPTTLSDGSALELTIGRYHTPSGRTVDGLGLEPDVEVPAGASRDAAVARALDVLTGLVASTGGRG